MRRALALLLAALAALGGACGGDDGASPGSARAEQVRRGALDAGLPDGVADVLADAAAAVDATYRVTYELDGRTVVVTQRPPDRRVDVLFEDGSADATISVEGSAHACSKPPGEDWRCEDLGSASADGAFREADVEQLVQRLTDAAGTATYGTEEREVAGTPARCVTTSPPPAALCIAATGALLLVEGPSGTLRATAYTTDVPDDAFTLPT